MGYMNFLRNFVLDKKFFDNFFYFKFGQKSSDDFFLNIYFR